ncbi:MAG: alcohol dehydrogenase catalytic domain-containing protein [Candidatus Bathyarchaeia archaeon]
MKALLRVGRGPREVEVREVDYPKLKPGWVIIAVKACGICGSDVHMFLSEWPMGPSGDGSTSFIFGHEFSGEVVEVGEGVKTFAKGDRVVCMPKMSCGKCYYCRSGLSHLCPNEPLLNGGMAEYVAVPEANLLKLPENVSYEEGALVEPLAVSYAAVYKTSQILPGQSAVIVGPGPIGLLTLMCVKLANPQLAIITGTSEDKMRLEIAEKIGADVTIDVTKKDVVKVVEELTNKLGVDVVYECAGAGLLDQAIDLLKAGGELVAIGHPTTKTQIKLSPQGYMRAQFKQLKILGHIIYDWKSFYLALQLLNYRKLDVKPLITHKVPLADALRGFELAMRKEAVKVLIIP